MASADVSFQEGLVGVELVVSTCEFSYSGGLSSLQLTWKVSSFRGNFCAS